MRYKFNILVGILLLVFSTLVSAEPNVSFSQGVVSTHTGEAFVLDVLMTDFPVTEGGGLVIHFDSKKLQVSNVAVDSGEWQFVNRHGDIDNVEGTVSGILFTSYKGVTGNARIATVDFRAVRTGNSEISLEESDVNPFASNGQKIGVTFKPTKIRTRR